MSKYISYGKWNKNYKYIILTTIFAFLTNYIFGYTFNDYLDEIIIFANINENSKNSHIIINYIFRYLGLILFSFILYKYEMRIKKNIYKSNYEDNNGNNIQSSSIKLIYNNSQENTKNKIIISPKFIILIMIIMVLQEISEDIFYKSNLRALDFWMFELPLLSYFNLKYFKFKIYRHHKLVIYLNLIICGILKIIYLIISFNFDNSTKKISVFKCYNEYWGVIPLGIIIYLIIITSRAFALSEIKVLMQYKYISPIKLLIIYGITGTIISTIIGLISSFIECNKIYSFLDLKICKFEEGGKTYFENIKLWAEYFYSSRNILLNILLLLIGIIMNCLYRLFYIFIIKNLTAIHFIFSNIFYTNLLVWIGGVVLHPMSDDIYLQGNGYIKYIFVIPLIIIIHLIIFFGLFIYLEMIELNFCNLNYNLKKSIIDRSIKDYELGIDIDEDDIQN